LELINKFFEKNNSIVNLMKIYGIEGTMVKNKMVYER
jgi:hypothetical protein